METWALESYGATNVLQEILTYKSDDIIGRNALYSALVSGKELPTPGTPESFNVLSYELKGLGMKLEPKLQWRRRWLSSIAIWIRRWKWIIQTQMLIKRELKELHYH
ncbi:hypothetical protein [Mycoplasmopsis cynos]|nr:hypothetical protein [Mycoplasmopsis cynos]UWV82146.1 hypothetical protein NW065_06330 [Mycoplasmopsis cynos]WAM05221.1 hypothetical protein ONA01_03945 [Mycoplasmopsis cynos]